MWNIPPDAPLDTTLLRQSGSMLVTLRVPPVVAPGGGALEV